jgi:hypothetical protein
LAVAVYLPVHPTEAVQTALQDDGFKIPSNEAMSAIDTAKRLLRWYQLSSNTTVMENHCKYLEGLFGLWLTEPPISKHIREQVWSRFSLLVASNHYVIFWQAI